MRNGVRTIMPLQSLPPALDAYATAVDDSIATCNGDLRGALKALIIANEFLERDLQKAAFAIICGTLDCRRRRYWLAALYINAIISPVATRAFSPLTATPR